MTRCGPVNTVLKSGDVGNGRERQRLKQCRSGGETFRDKAYLANPTGPFSLSAPPVFLDHFGEAKISASVKSAWSDKVNWCSSANRSARCRGMRSKFLKNRSRPGRKRA